MPTVSTNPQGKPFPKGPPNYKISIPAKEGKCGDYIAAMVKRAGLCADEGVPMQGTARCETEQVAEAFAAFFVGFGFEVKREAAIVRFSCAADKLKTIVAAKRAEAKAMGRL